MRSSKETPERLLKDSWETPERLLKDSWKTPERLLKDSWETPERFLKISERLLKIVRNMAWHWIVIEEFLRKSHTTQHTTQKPIARSLRCAAQAWKVSDTNFKHDYENSVLKLQILKVIVKSYAKTFLWPEENVWLNIDISHAINRYQSWLYDPNGFNLKMSGNGRSDLLSFISFNCMSLNP